MNPTRNALGRYDHGLSASERFWPRVEKTATCWIWRGGGFPNGYGCFRFDGRTQRAHRVAWMIIVGSIPLGMWVLHACNNRRCVRPGDGHLYIGTARENARDRDLAGTTARGDRHGFVKHPTRRPVGERNGTSKLTVAQVRDILALYAAGEVSQDRLAQKFGIAQPVLSRIVRLLSWKTV